MGYDIQCYEYGQSVLEIRATDIRYASDTRIEITLPDGRQVSVTFPHCVITKQKE